MRSTSAPGRETDRGAPRYAAKCHLD